MQPLDQNQCLVLHLKDPIHIYLEPEVQRHGMIIRHTFMKSKYPYLLYKMQKSRFNLQGTVFDSLLLQTSAKHRCTAAAWKPLREDQPCHLH